MRRRRLAFWILLAAFAAACVWWCLREPHDPRAVYRALPAQAAFASAHDGLGERAPGLCANPFVRSVLAAAGMSPQKVDEFAADPASRRWLRRLAQRETAIAYVPDLGGSGECWTLASWAGNRTRTLRWAQGLGLVNGARMVRLDRVHRCWLVEVKDLDPRLRVSVALDRGLLLACVSEDPLAVRHLIDLVERPGRGLSLHDAPTPAGAEALWTSPTADRAWMPGFPWRVRGRTVRAASLAVERLSAERVSASLSLAASAPFGPQRDLRADAAAARSLLGGMPEAVVVGDAAQAAALIEACLPSRARAMARPVLRRAAGDAAVFVSVQGGEYSSRVGGLFKVPSVAIGIRGVGPDAADAAAREIVDAVNAAYALGIVPRPVSAGGGRVVVLDATQDNAYGRTLPDERAAYAVVGDWLVIASNAKLVFGLAGQGAGQRPGAVAASAGNAPASPPVAATGWAAMRTAGKTMKAALAVWELALPQESPSRRQVRQARAWVDLLAQFKTLSADMTVSGATARATLDARE